MTDFQLFPALDLATEAALRHSIRRWGVLVPIFVSAGPWQPGVILDGHHRSRLAAEEGCGPPSTIPIPVEREEDAHELAQTLNLDRRHLDVDQRRLIVADLRGAGFSLR
jgi:ParB-like chromosome segregation protein Spo0J